MSNKKYVGQRIKRTEDPRLIKGLAHYVDDIRLPDTLHVSFVRSIYAHARITNVDITEAAKAPGVVAVFTGKDVSQVGPVPCASALPGLKVPDHRVLAGDKVYFVGHPIAAVVATDRYAARDAQTAAGNRDWPGGFRRRLGRESDRRAGDSAGGT